MQQPRIRVRDIRGLHHPQFAFRVDRQRAGPFHPPGVQQRHLRGIVDFDLRVERIADEEMVLRVRHEADDLSVRALRHLVDGQEDALHRVAVSPFAALERSRRAIALPA